MYSQNGVVGPEAVMDYDGIAEWDAASADGKHAIQVRWQNDILRHGRRYYSNQFLDEDLELVRANPRFHLFDPFGDPVAADCTTKIETWESDRHDSQSGSDHTIIEEPYYKVKDAPLVMVWAHRNREKAGMPLTFACSSFSSSRLRFFRRMHKWMYLTDCVMKEYESFTFSDFVKHATFIEDRRVDMYNAEQNDEQMEDEDEDEIDSE